MTVEHHNFQIPEVSWPTEITAGDLAKIDAYHAQRKSKAAAVALTIKDEANTTYLALLTHIQGKLSGENRSSQILDSSLLVLHYYKPASSIVIMEQDNPWLIRQFPGEKLSGMTPPELVDFYTNYELEQLTSQKPQGEFSILLKGALEHGRQRFHQLYQATQKAGL